MGGLLTKAIADFRAQIDAAINNNLNASASVDNTMNASANLENNMNASVTLQSNISQENQLHATANNSIGGDAHLLGALSVCTVAVLILHAPRELVVIIITVCIGHRYLSLTVLKPSKPEASVLTRRELELIKGSDQQVAIGARLFPSKQENALSFVRHALTDKDSTAFLESIILQYQSSTLISATEFYLGGKIAPGAPLEAVGTHLSEELKPKVEGLNREYKKYVENASKSMDPTGAKTALESVRDYCQDHGLGAARGLLRGRSEVTQQSLEKVKERALKNVDDLIPIASTPQTSFQTEKATNFRAESVKTLWKVILSSKASGGELSKSEELMQGLKVTVAAQAKVRCQREELEKKKRDAEVVEKNLIHNKKSRGNQLSHQSSSNVERIAYLKALREEKMDEIKTQKDKESRWTWWNWGRNARLQMYDRDIDLSKRRQVELKEEIESLTRETAELEGCIAGNMNDMDLNDTTNKLHEATATVESYDMEIKRLREGSANSKPTDYKTYLSFAAENPEQVPGLGGEFLESMFERISNDLNILLKESGSESIKELKTTRNIVSTMRKQSDLINFDHQQQVSDVESFRSRLHDLRKNVEEAESIGVILTNLERMHKEIVDRTSNSASLKFIRDMDVVQLMKLVTGDVGHSSEAQLHLTGCGKEKPVLGLPGSSKLAMAENVD